MNATAFKKWLTLGADGQAKSPLVMGILNITPDSFSDGGKFNEIDRAFDRAIGMVEQGADIIDIGAESSRPGAQALCGTEEINRIRPVLKKLRKATDICLSIDTYKPEVMEIALDLGIDVINDISALRQKGSLELLKQYDIPICLMHQNLQHQQVASHLWLEDGNICKTVFNFFEERLQFLDEHGFSRTRFILDPGIGFGKVCEDNLKLIKGLDNLKTFNLPLLLGISRKSFIGKVLDKNIDMRIFGGSAVTAYAFLQGANIHRTHDVVATKDTLTMLKAILEQDMKND